jgi:hypothetical protein
MAECPDRRGPEPGLEHLPTQDEVIAIAEAWRPDRSLATALLFQATFDAPLAEGPPGSGGGRSGQDRRTRSN